MKFFKFRTGIFLAAILCGLSVPVFKNVSDAASLIQPENIHSVLAGQTQPEEIFAAVVVQPLKIAVHSEKRIAGDFLSASGNTFALPANRSINLLLIKHIFLIN